jgi:hypothetical protein
LLLTDQRMLIDSVLLRAFQATMLQFSKLVIVSKLWTFALSFASGFSRFPCSSERALRHPLWAGMQGGRMGAQLPRKQRAQHGDLLALERDQHWPAGEGDIR